MLNIAAPGEHVVYIAYDADGEALYIGRTKNLRARLNAHSSSSEWYGQMQVAEWVPCASATDARRTEREYIETFQPPYNINDAVPLRPGPVDLPEPTADLISEMYDAIEEWGDEADDRLNAFIGALRRAGWTLGAIGRPLGYTREAVRLRSLRASARTDIPEAPRPPRKTRRVGPRERSRLIAQRLLDDQTVSELRTMARTAQSVNGGTAEDDDARHVSVDYTERIAALVLDGVGIKYIAEAVGQSYGAIRARLARHGYIDPAPSQTRARYVGKPAVTRRESCKRGHSLSGSNVRHVNGDPSHRVCRACERLRTSKYRLRIGRRPGARAGLRGVA